MNVNVNGSIRQKTEFGYPLPAVFSLSRTGFTNLSSIRIIPKDFNKYLLLILDRYLLYLRALLIWRLHVFLRFIHVLAQSRTLTFESVS